MDLLGSTFPMEIIDVIISTMCNKSKRILRSTNRFWYSKIKLDEFTIYFASARNLNDIVQHFSTHYKDVPIGIKLTKEVSSPLAPLPVQQLSILTHLTSLEFSLYIKNHNLQEQIEKGISTLTALTKLQKIIPHDGAAGSFLNLTTLKTNTGHCLALYSKLCDLLIRPGRPSNEATLQLDLIPYPNRLTSLSLGLRRNEDMTEANANALTQMCNLKSLIVHARDDQSGNTIPMQYSHLTNLDKLAVSRNAVSKDIFKLTQLTYLTLTSSPIHDQTLTAFVGLKELHINADLGDNFSCLVCLTNLEVFSTNQNSQAVNCLKWLNSKKLTRLVLQTHLSIYSNMDLSNISTVMELFTNPEFLFFDGHSFLKKLTFLEFGSKLTNFSLPQFTSLTSLPSLKKLVVWGHSGLVDEQLHEAVTLKALTNLQHLWLTGGSVSQQLYNDLVYLTQLTSLMCIIKTKTFLENPTVLSLLPLKELKLGRQITTPQLWNILSKLTELEYLDFMRVDSDDVINSFSVLTNLTTLCMKRTRRSRKVRGIYLTKLTGLQELVLISQPARQFHAKYSTYLTEKLTRLRSAQFR